MNKKIYFIFAVLFSLLSMGVANAQEDLSTKIHKYKVCINDANGVVSLGKDIVGKELTVAGGTWHMVDNSITNDYVHNTYVGTGDVLYIYNSAIFDETNIFSMVGKPVDTFTFVYTAINNQCLPAGEKVAVQVIIQPTAIDGTNSFYLCPGEVKTLNLRDYLPTGTPENAVIITNSLEGMAGAIAGASPNETLDITGIYEGTFSFKYTHNPADTNVCQDTGRIQIFVSRDVDLFTFAQDSQYYCIVNHPGIINLNDVAGATVNGGVWSVPAPHALIDGIKFDLNTITAPEDITFTYTYTDCDGVEQNKPLWVSVTDTLTDLFVDQSKDVCKTLDPTQLYDLMADGMGVTTGVHTGTWRVDSVPVGQVDPDVTSGQFDISQAGVGYYEFSYYPSNAATNNCELGDELKRLNITVGDVSGGAVNDGKVVLCVDEVVGDTPSNKYIVLSHKAFGIDKVNVIAWTGPSLVSFSNDTVYYSDLAAAGIGTHKFEFEYTSPGCADTLTGTGAVYVEVTSDLGVEDNYEISYCRPEMPEMNYLFSMVDFQVEGTWTLASTSPNTVTVVDGTTTDAYFVETAPATGDKTYVFTFTPANVGECNIPAEVTLTVHISDDKFI